MALAGSRNIEYVIFDMDGLMIDSERVYTDVTNEILAPFGKEMTWDIKAGCMGKPEREAAEHLLSFFPDVPLGIDEYLRQRNALQDLRWPHVQVLPGVRKLVQHLHAHNIPIAVATGSRRRNFDMKTSHLEDLFGCFNGRIICADDDVSASSSAPMKMRGKPFPDVFLVAARTLLGRDVGDPEVECTKFQIEQRSKGLVFEDALPGMQAAKRAGMSVAWVPDHNLLQVEHLGPEMADQQLTSLEEFRPEEWGLPPYPETGV